MNQSKSRNKKIKLVITHSGKFHADDVFSVAVLRILFGKFRLLRTRDERLMEKADIVLDVGGIYNSKKNRFDHHQIEGAGRRKNGVPYSSLGLIWKKYGKDVCGNEDITRRLDEKFVQQIDAVDNGFNFTKNFLGVPSYTISDMVYAFTPVWNEGADVDKSFNKTVKIAIEILEREIIKTRSEFEAEKFVKRAYRSARNKEIIILDKHYPWHSLAMNFALTKFVIYPRDDVWHVSAIRKNLLDFKLKVSFPSLWAGKRDGELVKASGVEDAIFCHKNLFLSVARSKEGAIMLAKKALWK